MATTLKSGFDGHVIPIKGPPPKSAWERKLDLELKRQLRAKYREQIREQHRRLRPRRERSEIIIESPPKSALTIIAQRALRLEMAGQVSSKDIGLLMLLHDIRFHAACSCGWNVLRNPFRERQDDPTDAESWRWFTRLHPAVRDHLVSISRVVQSAA